jgi:uncharacterized RDD family membrane protein YckC
MEYEDRVRIDTPEGVSLELTLAGVGSRFTAALIDNIIEGVVVAAAAGIVFGISLGPIGTAAFVLVAFAMFFGYDVLFEVMNGGRTPGKRRVGIRVVRTGGEPITFFPSAARNLMRLVDILPTFYVIGAISVLVTKRNQRLGDLVAGTIIVRERTPPAAAGTQRSFTSPPPVTATWDVSGVTTEELAAVRSFLERRDSITWDARVQLARTLADGLSGKVVGVADAMDPEPFLEHLAAAKAART